MEYNCLNQQEFCSGEYRLVPIRFEDRYLIMKWRNDQMYHLRQNKELTKEEQDFYFDNVVSHLFLKEQPEQILFSFLKNDELIGYGGLVHMSWEDKRSEMSFLLNPELVNDENIYEEYFTKFIYLMKEVNFSILDFHKLFTETYSHRSFHICILEKAGFELEGILRDHIIIEKKYFNSIIHSIIKNV